MGCLALCGLLLLILFLMVLFLSSAGVSGDALGPLAIIMTIIFVVVATIFEMNKRNETDKKIQNTPNLPISTWGQHNTEKVGNNYKENEGLSMALARDNLYLTLKLIAEKTQMQYSSNLQDVNKTKQKQSLSELQRVPDRKISSKVAESPVISELLYSEKIVLSQNVKTLTDARELLVYYQRNKLILVDIINELLASLDSYKNNSEVAEEVITKLFPAPQMAHDKFMSELTAADAVYLRLVCKAADIISIAVKRSTKRDEILQKIVSDARSLTEKIEDLVTVLISKYGDTGTETESSKEINILLSDLQILIESVKNYS